MLRILKFAIILLISNSIFSQNKENTYIILDNNSFYEILKKEGYATLEIPYYTHKDNWANEKSKNTKKNDDDLVRVESIPNKKSFKFYSIKKPVKKSNIDKINTFSVIDVSKESKMVWKEYPYEMIFIEKINDESYIFWYMKPEFNE